MNWFTIGLGGWLVLDGIYSIYKYREQSLGEQVIRVVRAGIGVGLIVLTAVGWIK